jgi:hypothetical protein
VPAFSLQLPAIRGMIDRRILLNYRVQPAVLARLLPEGLRPRLVNGSAMAGVCLIRLKQVRPRFLPRSIGMSSENAAHRIAVEWRQDGQPLRGVYIPRRDTSSRFNTIVGGRFFAGVHHRARFDVWEEREALSVTVHSDDGQMRLALKARLADRLSGQTVFGSLEEASDFYREGSLGYSPRRDGRLEGLELRSFSWRIQPLDVNHVESSFFGDPDRFPPGTAQFDSAFLMRGIPHEWRARGVLCCDVID